VFYSISLHKISIILTEMKYYSFSENKILVFSHNKLIETIAFSKSLTTLVEEQEVCKKNVYLRAISNRTLVYSEHYLTWSTYLLKLKYFNFFSFDLKWRNGSVLYCHLNSGQCQQHIVISTTYQNNLLFTRNNIIVVRSYVKIQEHFLYSWLSVNWVYFWSFFLL